MSCLKDDGTLLLLLEKDIRNELRNILIDIVKKKEIEIPFNEPASEETVESKLSALNEAHLAFWNKYVEYSNKYDGLFASRKPSKTSG